MNSTEKVFSDSLNKLFHGGFPEKGKLLIAFSGGIDSLALLVLSVKTLGKDAVHPVYVNHNLRSEGELKAEISLNRLNCERLGVELEVKTLAPGEVHSLAEERRGGTEDSARVLRYALLEKARIEKGCMYIATAHHRQDQIETKIMHLRSGSPVTSLEGIRQKDDERRIIRPLLCFEKNELAHYLKENGFTASHDSTNDGTEFERNEIRNVIIPELGETWPEYAHVIESVKEPENSLLCSRMRYLYGIWNKVMPGEELPQSLIRRVTDEMAEGGDFTVGSNGGTFTMYHGRLYLTKDAEKEIFRTFRLSFDPFEDMEAALPGGLVFRTNGKAVPSETPEKDIRLDARLFSGKPVIRFAEEGDSVLLKGGKKTVFRLLQDMGIAPVLRSRVPVLADDEGICAVFGRALGGKDRICVKFISSLALGEFSLYIVS